MAKWNDQTNYSMSFDMKADESVVDIFNRQKERIEDFETAITTRTKQLFDKYVGIEGEKKDELYSAILRVFQIGYAHGWNDRKEMEESRVSH